MMIYLVAYNRRKETRLVILVTGATGLCRNHFVTWLVRKNMTDNTPMLNQKEIS
jgi:hypothetical protein